MAKFDLSKKKQKTEEASTSTRKRKVKRKKRTTKSSKPESRQQLTLELLPVSEEHPPENDERIIITWESEFGWTITTSALANQHIKADIQMFGHSRVRYWAFLE